CLRSSEDSYGWMAVMDMGNRNPIGSCGTSPAQCPHIVAAFDTFSRPGYRWCGVHSFWMVPSVPPNDIPLGVVIPHGLTTNGLADGPYTTTLTQAVSLTDTTFNVAGEVLNA